MTKQTTMFILTALSSEFSEHLARSQEKRMQAELEDEDNMFVPLFSEEVGSGNPCVEDALQCYCGSLQFDFNSP